MMVTALTFVLALVVLLALVGLTATLYGVDSRESFADDRR